MLRRAGIDINMVSVDRSTLFSRHFIPGNFELGVGGNMPQVDDPSQDIGVFNVTGAARNYGQWSNPKVDELYQRQETALDPARRKALVHELQREVIAFAPMVYLEWGLRPIGYHPWVKNLPVSVSFWSNVYRYEQVWMSKP